MQGSNSDGIWNEAGVSLSIVITPPWWRTNWFRATCGALFLALLWAAYQYRMRQLQHAFEIAVEARVGERTRIARELHDTLLQSFHGLLLRFQTASYLMAERPAEAKAKLDGAIEQAAKAITEGRTPSRDCGRRHQTNDLALAIVPWATSSRATPPRTSRLHSVSPSRVRRGISTRFFATRSTRLRRKLFGMPSDTRMPGGSRSRSVTTRSSSDCACVTMARESIRW